MITIMVVSYIIIWIWIIYSLLTAPGEEGLWDEEIE
jgi:hypothetical protein